MSDEPAQHDQVAPEPWATADEVHVQTEPVARPRVWPRVVGVLILLLGVLGTWIWLNPGFVRTELASLFPGATGNDSEMAAIRALDARVTRLEQRPPADLGSLNQRLDALEKRPPPAAQSAGPPADLGPLSERLDALEARSAGAAKSAASEAPELRTLSARLDALATRIDATETRDQTDVSGKLDDLEHRLSALTADEAKQTGASDAAARLAWLPIALEAGRPLGAIPNAPPALTRFAATAPPTEAQLRLAFTAAAQAAVKVSAPETEGKPFLDQVMERLRNSRLVTIREGDRVLIGNSAAPVLARAQVRLDAGDLRGAVTEVSTLSGPAADKMAPWLADASTLVAARDALVALAENH